MSSSSLLLEPLDYVLADDDPRLLVESRL